MISMRLALIIAVSTALSLPAASVCAQTSSARETKPSASASPTIQVTDHAKSKTLTPILLNDAQMDGVTAGISFDFAGYSAAVNAWVTLVQDAIGNYSGAGHLLPSLPTPPNPTAYLTQ